ncbi:sensor histidine kinase [Radiobacillus sp. PE A8.2]|uniref:sensor histidine kinase n=1 Tax=Radiobacillus sp. PE A8.2 TaxID=3380349 RepID=UPI00388DD170
MVLIATLIFIFQIFLASRFEKGKYIKIIQSLLFSSAIIICMSFPAYITPEFRLDIRIVPLLLGTLYGGWGTGLFLSFIIILYRFYVGVDLGFYTTIITLIISIPTFIYYQKLFLKANKNKRILIALSLSASYCVMGIISTSIIREFSIDVLYAQLIQTVVTLAVVSFFVALNEMIKETLKKNQQLQTEIKDAELAFLRSQIKPHFLYNTLNSIAALCIDQPREAEKLTLDLSRVLRSGFDFKQLEAFTTLENELELVNAYVNIEKVRFGARLSVIYDVDADMNIQIPQLILQPLVENAIRHGLMSKLQGGNLKISIKEKEAGSVISFGVEDNGCGMSKEKLGEILNSNKTKKGIGLANINKRIKFLYDQNIRIESEEGKGTKVFFEIPV